MDVMVFGPYGDGYGGYEYNAYVHNGNGHTGDVLITTYQQDHKQMRWRHAYCTEDVGTMDMGVMWHEFYGDEYGCNGIWVLWGWARWV